MHHKAANGERASCYVNIFVICLVVLAVIQTITCKSNYRGGSSKLQSTTNISCMYSEFKTITCTWYLKECYKNDYNNPLDIKESVHIHYTFNVSTSQYCYRDTLVYLQCVCLQSGGTKCYWSHKSSQASESLSLSVAVHDSVTSKQLLSRNEQFELLDIVKPSPVNNLAVEKSTENGCLLVKWDSFQSYTDYVCELKTRSNYQNMKKTCFYLHKRPIFPIICNLHPDVVTLLKVRCRVMVMQTERGFWSNFSTVTFKIVNKGMPGEFSGTGQRFRTKRKKRWRIGKKGLPTQTYMETNLKTGMDITIFPTKIDSVPVSDPDSPNLRTYIMCVTLLTLVTLCILILSVLVFRNTIGRNGLPTQTHMETNRNKGIVNTHISRKIDRVEKQLHENNLPNNKDLQFIYKYHVGQYERLNEVCEKICKIIRNKLDTDAVNKIWPAHKLSNESIAFVVELAEEAAVQITFQHDLEIIIEHGDSTVEKESSKIMAKEREFLIYKTDEYRDKFKKLQPILTKHAKQLMDKHKNITAILPCVIKSVGYGTSDKHVLLETLCISIHVKRKISGFIPLDEEPILTMIEDIPTDVVQGEYRLFSNGSNDYHRNLKMGLAIHALASNNEGDILGGTLGCFVQHETYGMCCITNAHIVLQQSEIQHLFRCGYMEYGTSNEKPVFQPLSFNTEPFGKVVVAAGYDGNDSKPGLEVALIKILNRPPLSGSFPQSTSKTVPTFTFNTGNVADVNSLLPGIEVFKFGMETGPTLGFLHSHSAPFRDEKGFSLHQQIVVMPRKGENFADEGDSGSCVFIGFSQPGRESAIGLLTGGARGGFVYVTPIYDILQSLKCPLCLRRFKNVVDNGKNMSMPTQRSGGEETMDWNN